MAIGMSTGVPSVTPAAQALGLGGGDSTLESEQERKRRLTALQASQNKIGGALSSNPLSPAGALALGYS